MARKTSPVGRNDDYTRQVNRELREPEIQSYTPEETVDMQMMLLRGAALSSVGPALFKAMGSFSSAFARARPVELAANDPVALAAPEQTIALAAPGAEGGSIVVNGDDIRHAATQTALTVPQEGEDELLRRPGWVGMGNMYPGPMRGQAAALINTTLGTFLPCVKHKARTSPDIGLRASVMTSMHMPGMRTVTPADQMKAAMDWVRMHGMMGEPSSVSFTNLRMFSAIGNDYRPQVIIAMTENDSLLLVQETSGIGQMSMDPEQGIITINTYEDRPLTPGTILHTIPGFVGDLDPLADIDLTIEGLEGIIDFERQPNGATTIRYNGPELPVGGIHTAGGIRGYAELSEAAKNALQQIFPEVGILNAGQRSISPLSQTTHYLYRVPGLGRSYYRMNPHLMGELERNLATPNFEVEFDLLPEPELAAPANAAIGLPEHQPIMIEQAAQTTKLTGETPAYTPVALERPNNQGGPAKSARRVQASGQLNDVTPTPQGQKVNALAFLRDEAGLRPGRDAANGKSALIGLLSDEYAISVTSHDAADLVMSKNYEINCYGVSGNAADFTSHHPEFTRVVRGGNALRDAVAEILDQLRPAPAPGM